MPAHATPTARFQSKSGLSGATGGCYNFASWQGGYLRLLLDQVQRVLNSLAANRRLAFRVVAIQAAIATLVALAFLTQDASAAVAAAIGGGAMVLGSLILAWWSTKGLAYSAGHALVRLTTGIALKWFVVFSMLYLAFVRLGLPPLPLLAGLIATTASSFLVYKLKA